MCILLLKEQKKKKDDESNTFRFRERQNKYRSY